MNRHILLILIFVLCFFGCEPERHPLIEENPKKEILVFCGITMVEPVMEMKEIFESENNAEVRIIYGGSGHLKKAVEVNKVGDIFFPGSPEYVRDLQDIRVVDMAEEVGFNILSVFVKKGNPKEIKADLNNLADRKYKVVIGSKIASSLGKETFKILSKYNLYDKVAENALYMTTDSKGVSKALRDSEADIVVNWRAAGYQEKNLPFMDELRFENELFEKNPLIMGRLVYSKETVLAEKFLSLAKSDRGKSIFRKYGFLD